MYNPRTKPRGESRDHHEARKLDLNIRFKNNSGNCPPELFDSTAREAAKKVADVRREMNKGTQVRRFYDELVMWEEKVRQNPERFDEYLPFIRMLKAKAAYAKGRKLVDTVFVELLEQIIDSVNSFGDLRTAKLFFEAFLGFYKVEKGD